MLISRSELAANFFASALAVEAKLLATATVTGGAANAGAAQASASTRTPDARVCIIGFPRKTAYALCTGARALVNEVREKASLLWLLALAVALFALEHPALLGALLVAQFALWINSGLPAAGLL